MKTLAIMGSYRKGKTIDTLIDRAIEGVRSIESEEIIEKINLIEKKIDFCRNCMHCRNDCSSTPASNCTIQDDMEDIYPMLVAADSFIFATPINFGHETAIMKTFIERMTYILARPNPGSFPIRNIPEPRFKGKPKKAVIIVSTGVVPPVLRWFCDSATPLLRDVCKTCLNAKIIGTLYAGAVEKKGLTNYLEKSYKLGQKLAML